MAAATIRDFMQIRDVIVVGAGGHGLVVTDILLAARDAGDPVRVVAVVDDDPARTGSEILGVPVIGTRRALAGNAHDAVVVAIGDNARRRAISEELLRAGERLAIARHPTAWRAHGTEVGDGAMLCAGSYMLPNSRIGRGTILNTRASVDHETVVGDFAHVSAAAFVGANVTIGDETFVAAGATVISGITIGARSTIGAGAVVVRNLPDDVTAWGVPARVIERA